MTTGRTPLYYTFGNHMHWVDMEWLWGAFVLPSSTRDMLALCETAGVKGNVNFDGIGYEKLAVEAPSALAALRDAVRAGTVEVVGASYGQPYGLFHGGESNVRQRAYGVRAVLRLLGVRPRSFWEEEFDFCPQLPQILAGAGFRYASLFFQWTWHTPETPRETLPAVWWEGMDGTRLLAAPRGPLNLHQWPEDFAGLLDSPALREMPAPGIVQWLELMPSPDWMCRSEVILPPLRALLDDPRFEIRPVTLSEYLEVARPHAQPRRYTLDDVFHGMSLGKNGDLFRRWSRRAEQGLLAAESLSALAGLFGRPYPSWNVYPTWELEESWRELLAAQHHDNDECEGLCGFVGLRSYERSLGLSGHVLERTARAIAARTHGPAGRPVAFNPLGWARDAAMMHPQTGETLLARGLPPFGYRAAALEPLAPVTAVEDADAITLSRGALRVAVDRARGVVRQIWSSEFPEGVLPPDAPLADLEMTRDGAPERFAQAVVRLERAGGQPQVSVERTAATGETVRVTVRLAPELDAVDIAYDSERIPRPDGRMHASLQTTVAVALPEARLVHDHPYGVSEVRAEGVYKRKYPTGDWMTSPQVFEEVRQPFTALQLVDLHDGARGLLYLHDGSQAFFRAGSAVCNILSMYDPWDEAYFVAELRARVRVVPHGPLDHARRWRLAQEFTRPPLVALAEGPGGDVPAAFAAAWCDAPGVALTALYRETAESGEGLEGYAGDLAPFPYVLRLVELNGEPATARVRLPGPVAAAYRTNLMGEHAEPLDVGPADSPFGAGPGWSEVAVELRPNEIATLYMDVALGRKVTRDLDAHRGVWATVHRVES